MQFIERSVIGVRSAVYELSHKNSKLKFSLFPMIHIGEKSFYEAVNKRLLTCDSIIMEGVETDSFSAKKLISSYSGDYLSDIGLVEQSNDLLLKDYQGKIIHKDFSKEKFDRSWAQLSWKLKVLLTLSIPFVKFHRNIYGSRERIARKMNVTDLEIREGSDFQKYEDELNELIVEKRDDHLLRFLRGYIAKNREEPKRTGIVWGAKHMPAIAHYLLINEQYSISSSEWVLVFSLNE